MCPVFFVDDQAKALDFYRRVLGFTLKNDVPVGEHLWLTVVSPEDPDGTELLLEPGAHPAVPPYKTALVEDGIELIHMMRKGQVKCVSTQRLSLAAQFERLAA
jgi:catechol 2,3-dioxygenase-like lactoylglutathione lyase family enzyme